MLITNHLINKRELVIRHSCSLVLVIAIVLSSGASITCSRRRSDTDPLSSVEPYD